MSFQFYPFLIPNLGESAELHPSNNGGFYKESILYTARPRPHAVRGRWNNSVSHGVETYKDEFFYLVCNEPRMEVIKGLLDDQSSVPKLGLSYTADILV